MISWAKDLDRLLRGEATQLDALKRGTVDVSAVGLVVLILLLGVFYGVCMGVFALMVDGGPRYMQLLATAVKVPMLFLFTLAVTFPSLYVFNALVGSRLMVGASFKLLISSLAVMLAVLASLGPIVAFFTLSTDSYAFMKLLNVVVFAISGFLGLGFLLQTLHRMTLAQEPVIAPLPMPRSEPEFQSDESPDTLAEDAPTIAAYTRARTGALDRPDDRTVGRPVKSIFRIWILVFGLVGAQMAWIMRPFIGDPRAKEFVWFRPRGESNFFEAVWEAFKSLMGAGSGGW